MSAWSVRQWSEMDPGTRRHVRWLYRQMRGDGIEQSTARMYLLGGINAGYLAGIKRGLSQ